MTSINRLYIFVAVLMTLLALPVSQSVANTWTDLNESENYTARHESSFVQAGDRFYLFGGRENPQTLDTYDFRRNNWSRSAQAPIPFNHFQATEYQGLIWVIGAFKNNSFPNEAPAEHIYTYDPANNFWLQGREIPSTRRRGSAGLVEYRGKFYVVGGNTIGHNGGYVSWFDEYDPQTGIWRVMPDAPNARDHFHATVANDKLYVVGGRLSGGPGGTFSPLIATVDVYDFATRRWSSLPGSGNLPTPRAAGGTVTFQGKVLVMGGEGENSGPAFKTVEQLDPDTNLWSEIAPMNFARHGTQAIVSGNGIFIAGGSPNRGGGRQRNMEAFNSTTAVGSANTQATLEFALGEIVLTPNATQEVDLLHVNGSQGALVTSIALAGNNASSFSLTNQTRLPNLVIAGGSRTISVRANSNAEGASTSLVVTYDDGVTVSVPVRTGASSQNGGSQNVALGATAEQSSTAFGGNASRAVDGNTEGRYGAGSVTHTNFSAEPWWQVDLGGLNAIDNIVLRNRTDCCTNRLSNFYVFASRTPFGNRSLSELLNDNSIERQFRTGLNGDSITVGFNNTQARYVRVQLQIFGALSLAEVEVMGTSGGGSSSGRVSYEYFEGTWSSLPNFDQLNPVDAGFLDSISLDPARLNDFFAFRYNATLNVTRAGTYTFFTASDDGSALFINGRRIVNNDGLHGLRERQGSVQLGAGEHDIVVTYFERTGGNTLNVNWQGPGFSKQSIDSGLAGGSVIAATQLTLGSAAQSSTGFGGVAARAIDGNTNGSYGGNSVTHTASNDAQAWWQASLARSSNVTEIELRNRTDNCCTSRLSDFYVFISDRPFTSDNVNQTRNDPNVRSFFQAGAAGQSLTIPVNATGRYIRVQQTGTAPLSLAEVLVFGGS